MPEEVKKRNRLTFVCSYCKRRKVKCDKGRPCSACVRHNVGHLCNYEDNPWIDQNGNQHDAEASGTVPAFVVSTNKKPRHDKPNHVPQRVPGSMTNQDPLRSQPQTANPPQYPYARNGPMMVQPPPPPPQHQHQHQLQHPEQSFGPMSSFPPNVGQPTFPSYSPVHRTSFTGSEPPREYHVHAPPHDQQQPPSQFQPAQGVAISVNGGSDHSSHMSTPNSGSGVQSELDALKDKIRQIEASITVTKLSQSHAPAPSSITPSARNSISMTNPNWQPPESSQIPPQVSGSYIHDPNTHHKSLQQQNVQQQHAQNQQYLINHPIPVHYQQQIANYQANQEQIMRKLSSESSQRGGEPRRNILTPPTTDHRSPLHQNTTNNASIQLPPLNLTSGAGKLYDHSTYEPAKLGLWNGINPVESSFDTINFYEGYTPIHIRESARRQNYGPFSWLSIMWKDPFMLVMWKILLTKRGHHNQVFQQAGIYPKGKEEGEGNERSVHSDIKDGSKTTSIQSDGDAKQKRRAAACAAFNRDGITASDSDPDPANEANDSEDRFREKALDRDGFNDIRPYQDLRRQKNEKKESEEEYFGQETTKVNENQSTVDKGTAGKNSKSIDNQESESSIKRVKTGANMKAKGSPSIQKMNENTISLGLTLFDGKIDQELKLIERIEVMLPNRKVVWILINKFFKNLYPYAPIIDETDFKADISKILGEEKEDDGDYEVYAENEERCQLKVEKRLDFACLGILQIMLRFSYLSLFTNRNGVNEANIYSTDTSKEARELRYLLLNPITIDIVNNAELCLDQFSLLKQSNMMVLQCVFFMRLYHKYAPEEGDGADGGDSQIATALLMQMSYSIGLNRESDNFKDIEITERAKNLSRKMWYFLAGIDLVQSFSYGNPLNIDPKYYDTKVPFYKEGNENVNDPEMEKRVIFNFKVFETVYWQIKDILDISLSISEKINLKVLCSKISNFENVVAAICGNLEECMVPFDEEQEGGATLKAQKCKNIIHFKYFMINLFMHIYLHYEGKGNSELAYFYLRKLLSIAAVELMGNYVCLIWNMHIFFGEGAMIFLNPTFEEAIHKVNQLNFMIIIRLNLSIHRMKKNPDHEKLFQSDVQYRAKFSKLCQLSSKLEKCTELCLIALSKLKNRYYCAWRIGKSHSFMLKRFYEEDLYERLDAQTSLSFLDISPEQMEELIEIADVPLRRHEELKAKIVAEDKITRKKVREHKAKSNIQTAKPNAANTHTDKEIRKGKHENNNEKVHWDLKRDHQEQRAEMHSAKSNHNQERAGSQRNKNAARQSNHLLYVADNTVEASDPSTANSEFDEVMENANIDNLWYDFVSKKSNLQQAQNQNSNAATTYNYASFLGQDPAAGGSADNSNQNYANPEAFDGNYNNSSRNNNGYDLNGMSHGGPFINTPIPEDNPLQFLRDLDMYPFDYEDFSNRM